jgi:hypothetical protein
MAIIDERTRSASVIAGTYSELLEVDVGKGVAFVGEESVCVGRA